MNHLEEVAVKWKRMWKGGRVFKMICIDFFLLFWINQNVSKRIKKSDVNFFIVELYYNYTFGLT